MIVIAETNDYETIRDIAHKTWPLTYGSILSKAQLNYMLELFYSAEALQINANEKNHHFLLVKENKEALAFLSYEHQYQERPITRIHKIYILPETQGKGIGKLLIDCVEALANETKSEKLSLNVNRYNNAQFFYKKLGFEIVAEEDVKLDHGYLMEDYIMEKPLLGKY
ncbi:N-acetyltransferase [Flavobacterium noncentrifugens]|uniref:Ribosomal protein S18 acetylase RimI n=1 Tax=Flavobacterium noncentrifugens TaxID=1128970 RepID=A0A1G8WFH7_9FLAO|nr:GNAT family N-acetyltransferase [Flavobacterium noncentrifugens]GEP50904.1 N-acetyltransferase [Flavobacterium noncentrifugens]SDJ76961.1 Ribosomal protein S18 acetylase RimI [Flavobacterium noncentrifugens]